MVASMRTSGGPGSRRTAPKAEKIIGMSRLERLEEYARNIRFNSGSIDIDSDERFEVDKELQQKVDEEQRKFDELEARSDDDWQRQADERNEEVLQQWQESEAKPEPTEPAGLQAALDDVRNWDLPEQLHVVQTSMLRELTRLKPTKSSSPKPEPETGEGYKARELKDQQEFLQSAEANLKSEVRRVEQDNAVLDAVRAELRKLRATD